MTRFGRSRAGREGGFTLVEMMVAMSLLGIGLGWITLMFMSGYDLWRRNYLELQLQQNARNCMGRMVQSLREARAGTIVISNAAGAPFQSQISFTNARDQYIKIWQTGQKIAFYLPSATGVSSTTIMVPDDTQTLFFTFPDYTTIKVVEIGLTLRRLPVRRSVKPVVIQLVERVLARNP